MRRGLVSVVVVVVGFAGVACGAGGGENGGRPRLPSLAPSGGRELAATSGAGMAADSAASLSYPARPIEYRLRDGVAVDQSSAAAYRIEGDAVAEDDVRRVADALGVAGDVRDAEGQLTVGGGDRSVGVDKATGRWWLNDETAARSDTVTACAPDHPCEPEQPKPLPDLPSEAEVRDLARAFADKVGMDVAEMGEVAGDAAYYRSVTITPRVGGRLVRGLETHLTFGSRGVVVGGGGAIGAPAKIGDYPLVPVREAFDRAQAGGGWSPYPLVDRDAAAAKDAAATDAAGGGASGSSGSSGATSGSAGVATDPAAPTQVAPVPGGTGGAEPDPGPGGAEPTPEPGPPTTLEPEIVELTAARLVLSVAYPMCPGDATYLVPMYELTGGDHVVPVLALEDEDVQDGGTAPADAGDGRAGCEIPAGREGESPPSPGVTDGRSPPVTG